MESVPELHQRWLVMVPEGSAKEEGIIAGRPALADKAEL